MGVKEGVIGTLTRRLIENPRNLELTPVGGGRFEQNFFEEMARRSETAFIIPETRSIAANIRLAGPDRPPLWLDLSASRAGDPLLKDAGLEATAGGGFDSIFVSESAAEKLKLRAGQEIEGLLSRRLEGRMENAALPLKVAGIVPRHIISRDVVFCSLELMMAAEDYRNGFAVPQFGAGGAPKPEAAPRFASFRLYAKDLDDVERLRRHLADMGVETYTRAEEIAAVRSLERSFSVVFLVLATVVGLGAFASLASSALDQVAKMRRSLALLRLLGYGSAGLMLFVLAQAALTGFLAALCADGLFLGMAAVLNDYFGASLGLGERICWLPPVKLLAVVGLSLLFMLAASATAGFSLSGIEPSEGMRDV